MRCDPAWFRETFLEDSAPASMQSADDIWPYVRGFNEYDGLATVVAATISHPALFEMFFKPSTCPFTGTVVVGRTSDDLGITHSAKASEMLHDLMVNAFERRFRRGLRIEIRGTGDHAHEWHLAILARPRRGQGPSRDPSLRARPASCVGACPCVLCASACRHLSAPRKLILAPRCALRPR